MNRGLALLLACVMLLSACGKGDAPPDQDGTLPGDQTSGEDAAPLPDEQEVTELVLKCAELVPDAFDSPSQIPAYSLTRFLYTRMEADGAADSFEHTENDWDIQVPIERIREYAERYFSMDKVTVDFISQRYFDGQSVSIPNPLKSKIELPYTFTVDRVDRTSGGASVTLRVSSGGVEYQRWIYSLRTNPSGGYYITSMAKRPLEFGLYAVNNVAATVDELLGIPVNSMTVGEFYFVPMGNRMVAAITNGRALRLGLFGTDTYTSGKTAEFGEGSPAGSAYDIQAVGESLFVYQPGQVTVLDSDLNEVKVLPYPDGLLRHCDSYTKRFALSPDQRYIAFSNIDGLNFYNMSSGDIHLMQTHAGDGALPMTWEPVAFNAKNNSLLAKLAYDGGVSMFGILNTQNTERAMASTIPLRGDKDTLFTLFDDRLMAFAPTSVKFSRVDQPTVLDQAYAEYNVATGTPRVITTDLALYRPDGKAVTADGNMLLAGDDIYTTETIKIGEDMVSSLSVRAYDVALQKGQSLDFGYVDRRATLKLLAANTSGKVIAACSGMFVQTIVVL